MKNIITFLLLFVFLLTSCTSFSSISGPTPTPDICRPSAVEEYYDAIDGVGRRFDDATELANSTPRMSLPPLISDLQAIRRDAEDLKVPYCAEKARQALVDYMDAEIDAFIAFLGDESDSELSKAFDRTEAASDKYWRELLYLEKLITPTPSQ